MVKDQRKNDSKSETHEFCRLFVDNSEAESEQRLILMNQTSLEDDPSTIELQYRPDLAWTASASTFVVDDGSVIAEPIIVLKHAGVSRVNVAFQDLYHSDQPALRID